MDTLLIELPFTILCLAKLIDNQNEDELFGTGRVGVGEGIGVVPSIRRTLKPKQEVTAVHHRDVLVIVECPVEPVGGQISENKVIPAEDCVWICDVI